MSLARGIALFNEGRFWEAHEAWEEVWMLDRHGPERAFYKGLIQVAAGCLHYTRHNRRGAVNKLGSGSDLLRSLSPTVHGVDVAELVAAVDALRAGLSSEGWPDSEPPRIQSRETLAE